MIDQLSIITTLATEIQAVTSRNDPRREKLQTIITVCDEIYDHYIDDGK